MFGGSEGFRFWGDRFSFWAMTCCELCEKQQALVKQMAFSKEMAMWSMCAKRVPMAIEVVKFQLQELIDYNERYFFTADCFCGEVRSLRRGASWASSCGESESLSDAAAWGSVEAEGSWMTNDSWCDGQDSAAEFLGGHGDSEQ